MTKVIKSICAIVMCVCALVITGVVGSCEIEVMALNKAIILAGACVIVCVLTMSIYDAIKTIEERRGYHSTRKNV